MGAEEKDIMAKTKGKTFFPGETKREKERDS